MKSGFWFVVLIILIVGILISGCAELSLSEKEVEPAEESKEGFATGVGNFFRRLFGGSPTGQLITSEVVGVPEKQNNPILGIISLVFIIFLGINLYYRFYKKEQLQQWIDKRRKSKNKDNYFIKFKKKDEKEED